MNHGGNIRHFQEVSQKEKIIDFSANINPLGPPEWVRPLLSRNFHTLVHYPDPDYLTARKARLSYYNITIDHILLLNGVAEGLAFGLRTPQR